MTTTLTVITEEKLKHLSDLEPGESGIIDCLHFDDDYRERIYGMGLRCNDRVHCIRRAPFGGPIHVKIRNTELFLRLREAKLVCLK